jgi:hypothetical protein
VAQQHPRLDFVRGDTWKIYGTIEDDRGHLMDVSALIASIHWVLANEANVKVGQWGRCSCHWRRRQPGRHSHHGAGHCYDHCTARALHGLLLDVT